MTLTIYHISCGLESRFDTSSKFWFYRSKFEKWFIVRMFGIYFWFVPKVHKVFE